MAREVYPSEEFIELSRRFVFVRVLTDKDPNGAELQNRYLARNLPTLLVLDSRGREVERLIGGRPLNVLIEDLEWILDNASENSPYRL